MMASATNEFIAEPLLGLHGRAKIMVKAPGVVAGIG
jgi:hypothetical protein